MGFRVYSERAGAFTSVSKWMGVEGETERRGVRRSVWRQAALGVVVMWP